MEVKINNKALHKICKFKFYSQLLSNMYKENETYVNGVHQKLLIEEAQWFERNSHRIKNSLQSFDFTHIERYFKKLTDNSYLSILGPFIFLYINVTLFFKYYLLQVKYLKQHGKGYTEKLMQLQITPAAFIIERFLVFPKFLLNFVFSYNVERFLLSSMYCFLIFVRSLTFLNLQISLFAFALLVGLFVRVQMGFSNALEKRNANQSKKSKYVTITE